MGARGLSPSSSTLPSCAWLKVPPPAPPCCGCPAAAKPSVDCDYCIKRLQAAWAHSAEDIGGSMAQEGKENCT